MHSKKYGTISWLFFWMLSPVFLLAQTGTWKATIYPGGIVKLQWQHAAMQHTEAIGDAVIASPIGTGFVIKSNEELGVKQPPTVQKQFPAETFGKGPIISLNPRRLKVLYGDLNISFTHAYDSGAHRGLLIEMLPSDRWYGGGERSLPLQRNGQRIPLYNAAHYGYELNADELNFSVPFIFTTRGYGLLFSNPSKGFIDFGKTTPGILQAGFESGELNVFVIPGETPADIIKNYTALTGFQPLPPRWALGNFVSRFGYRSQAQAMDVISRMQKDSFPVDAIVIDIFWFGDSIKGTLGNLDWVNKTKWPSPHKMIADFRAQNINTVLVTEPFVLKGTKNFEASLPHLATYQNGRPYMLTQFYFGFGGLLDLFKPTAQQWFWKFYKKQTDLGVAGWWGDLGEPENHPADVFHNLKSFGVKRPMSANEVHNMYGHMWSKMLFENWRTTYPNKRLFFLNRAGFAGSQRYSIFPWTGDVSRTWNGFKAQLPNLQSMSMSGVPYIHSDAGGFSNVPENDQELYVRWLQMAGFTPVFRPHGTAFGDLEAGVNDLPSEPTFKEEPFKSMALEVVRQRYQLLPYLYTMAWQQATKSLPLIRPMLYAYPTDSVAANATSQYMFGDALLIAPVTEKGQRQQTVYVPEGTWYQWQGGSKLNSSGWQTLAAPLHQTPVLVKGGSLLPYWPEGSQAKSTADFKQNTSVTFRYFAGSSSQPQWFYDDDGNNPDALQQPHAHQLLKLEAKQDGKKHRITIKAVNWPKGTRRTFLLDPIGFGNTGYTVNVGGSNIIETYLPHRSFSFDFTGQEITIALEEL